MTSAKATISPVKRALLLALKFSLSLVAVAILGFLALVLINAFDEDLSADAQALLAPPQMGKVEDGNGFVAFLGMQAPADQDQMAWGRKAAAAYMAQAQPGFVQSSEWKEATRGHLRAGPGKAWCTPESRDCLAEAKRDATPIASLLAADGNRLFLTRYRKAREAATFADVYVGANPAATIPPYGSLAYGASLALADVALKLASGDVEGAVAELEQEVGFHRRMIAGGRSLIAVMIGNRLLSRDLLTISELVRGDGERVAPYRARLAALARPQASAAALEPALRFEAHTWTTFAHRIRAILRDNGGWMLSGDIHSPALNWAQSLFALPNQTANLVAATAKIEFSIAAAPAAQFDAKAKEIDAAKMSQLARPWYSNLRNPVGKANFEDTATFTTYAARMHDLQALERMTSLQIALAESGAGDAAAAAAFVAGEGGKTYSDPYTGKPFAFDPAKRLLSFEPRAKGGIGGDLKKRYGRAGIAL